MSVGRNRHKQLSNIVNTQYGVWSFSVSLYSFTSVQSELGLSSLKQHWEAGVQALRSCGTRLNNGLHWTNWPKSRFVELVHITTCRENLSLATRLETVVQDEKVPSRLVRLKVGININQPYACLLDNHHFNPSFYSISEKTEHSPVNYAAIILFLSILTEKNEILKSRQV